MEEGGWYVNLHKQSCQVAHMVSGIIMSASSQDLSVVSLSSVPVRLGLGSKSSPSRSQVPLRNSKGGIHKSDRNETNVTIVVLPPRVYCILTRGKFTWHVCCYGRPWTMVAGSTRLGLASLVCHERRCRWERTPQTRPEALFSKSRSTILTILLNPLEYWTTQTCPKSRS